MSRPATPGQLRFYLLDGADGGAARTLVKHLTAEGPVAAGRLRRALRHVVVAHPALRTSLHLEDDGLVQHVHDADEVETAVVETEEPEALAEKERAALAVPFVHGRGPLCRIRAFVGPGRTHCLIAVHHAVFDDDSTAILLTALGTAYEKAAAEVPDAHGTDAHGTDAAPPVPAEGPAPLGEARREELRAAWREYLDGCPQTTEPPWTVRGSGRRREIRDRILPEALSGRLKERAELTGAGPFAQFLTAVCAVLSWYLDRDDVVVAVPVSGRGTGGDQRIGCLQNTVPVRLRLSGADTATAVDRTVDALLDALEMAELPFEDILDSVGAVRRPDRKPLAQVLCTEIVPVPETTAGGVRWRVNEQLAEEAEYDCGLALCHLPDGRMRLEVAYRSGALPPDRAAHMLDHVVRFLEQAAGDPGRPLAALDLLGDEERRELSVLAGQELAPVSHPPVHELVFRHARDTPDAVAVTGADGSLSYAELAERAGTVAGALAGSGVRSGDRVGICLPRGTDLVAAVLGVWQAGGVYVPLDPEYPQERLRYVAEDADLAALLGDRALPQALRDLPGRPALDMAALTGSRPPGEPPAAGAAGPGRAYLIYTSGSTGRPKGVVVGHAQLTALFDACDRELPGAAVTVAGTSLSFDISALELFWPLTRGRTVLVTGHRQVTGAGVPDGALYQCTPTVARLLTGDPDGRALLGRLGGLLVGGEPLPQDLADDLAALVPGPVVNCYGPTETTVWSTVSRVRSGDPVRIGLPLPGESCHVVDALGRALPPGCPGRLVIGGAGVAEGYWRRPQLTEERFVATGGDAGLRGYDTGDLAVLDDPGGLRFLGRRDGQCKILGQRVELEEAEAALRSAPGVPDLAVAPNAAATQLVAFLPDGQAADRAPASPESGSPQASLRPVPHDLLDTLRAHAEDWLPPVMVPVAWYHVPALPQLPNGKLDRGTLARWAAEPQPGAPGGATARTGSTGTRLRQVWERVLGAPVSDPDATFFDLGGTSNGMLRVLAALRTDHPGLTVGDLFRHTTLRTLAAHLDGHGTAAADTRPTGDTRGRDRSRALSTWRARRQPAGPSATSRATN
ncbi:non-ribosomal peptide synthetase [Streptomyces sclerotialus]|uniref:non-ribosomal peptide synthetase n=1 Tax=Streptomyces sclerotialus TaxID=1957 RepID=UPI0004CA46A1